MKSGIKAKSSNVHSFHAASRHPPMERRSLGLLGVLHDARHAFEGLCARAGLAVLEQLMEEDRTELCGPKGVPLEHRSAVRRHDAGQRRAGGQAYRSAAPARA